MTLPTFHNSLETLLKSNADSRSEARRAYRNRQISHRDYVEVMAGLENDRGMLLGKVLELATAKG